MRRIIVLVLACALLLVSCLRPLRESEVEGTYEAEAGSARSTLMLEGNHEFHQSVQYKNGTVATAVGQWHIQPQHTGSASGLLVLTKLLRFDHEKQQGWWPGGAFSITAVGFTGIEISVDPNWGIAYRKQR
jgi:hypothetical protein